MKLFLDMRPAFVPSSSPLAELSFGLASAALAQGAEDVFFVRNFACDPDFPEAALLPTGFIEWVVQHGWQGGAHLRKLADQAVQQAHLGKALVKFESETRVALLVAPVLAPAEMDQFDAVALASDDLSLLRFPDLPEKSWEQGWRRQAAAVLQRADLICCASESTWRDCQQIAGEAAPAIVTPMPFMFNSAARIETSAPEARLLLLGDRGVLWEPLWAAVRQMSGQVARQWRLEVLHGLFGATAPEIPADITDFVILRQIFDEAALFSLLQRSAAVLDLSVTSTEALVARQANHLGVPVIAAIGRGAADLCDAATTQLVDPQNPDGVMSALARAVSEPITSDVRAALAERAKTKGGLQDGARLLKVVLNAAARGAREW